MLSLFYSRQGSLLRGLCFSTFHDDPDKYGRSSLLVAHTMDIAAPMLAHEPHREQSWKDSDQGIHSSLILVFPCLFVFDFEM